MDFKNLYTKLETANLSIEEKKDIWHEMSLIINDDNFNFQKSLESESRYKRIFLVSLANTKTFNKMAKLSFCDDKWPGLLIHSLLSRISHNTVEENISPIIKIITNQRKIEKPGTTLSYAIGYTLAQGIFSGINVNEFARITCLPLSINKKRLLEGVKQGLKNPNEGLIRNKTYIESYLDRYAEHWSEQGLKICLNVMRDYHKQTLSENISNKNEKIMWLLSKMYHDDGDIQKLYKEHTIEEIDVSKIEIPVGAVDKITYDDSTIDEDKLSEEVSIVKTDYKKYL